MKKKVMRYSSFVIRHSSFVIRQVILRITNNEQLKTFKEVFYGSN